jgi:hypothetical protein
LLQTPQKATTKNNQVSLVRTPDFSSTRDIRKRRIIFPESQPFFQESQQNFPSLDAKQTHQEKSIDNHQQQNIRLMKDRLRKKTARASENEQQRTERLGEQRHRSTINRSNENQQQRNVRLSTMRQRSKASRANESEHEKHERTRSMSTQRRQKAMDIKQQARSEHFVWPKANPKQLKERGLQDFINEMSITALRQLICVICNTRTFADSMSEHILEDIPNRSRIICPTDLLQIISGTSNALRESGLKYLLLQK